PAPVLDRFGKSEPLSPCKLRIDGSRISASKVRTSAQCPTSPGRRHQEELHHGRGVPYRPSLCRTMERFPHANLTCAPPPRLTRCRSCESGPDALSVIPSEPCSIPRSRHSDSSPCLPSGGHGESHSLSLEADATSGRASARAVDGAREAHGTPTGSDACA